jgi:predicted transcriptional regulator
MEELDEMAKAIREEQESSKTRGLKEGEERKSLILESELVSKMDAIAYWDRETIKDVYNAALREYVGKYEKKHGTIKPIPKK